MNELLLTIKEVQEGGKRLANHLLDRGYLLLDVQASARQSSFPATNLPGNQYQYYVNRNPVYVLGRPEGVEPAEPLPRREIDNKPKGA